MERRVMRARRALVLSAFPSVFSACAFAGATGGLPGSSTTVPVADPGAAPSTRASARPFPSSSDEPDEVVAFAASSLANVFDRMWLAFRAQPGNEGSTLTANYGASTQLRAQIGAGARADVFASADHAQMDLASRSGLIDGDIRTFTRNRLVVIVPRTNPGRIRGLADLSRPGLRIVTTPEDVPIGAYTRTAFRKMAANTSFGAEFDSKVFANVVSEESNVRQLVVKVHLGEADAGVCYATDVLTSPSGEVTVIEIPDAFNMVVEYPIALVRGARAPILARRLIAFVLSKPGQAILADERFRPIE